MLLEILGVIINLFLILVIYVRMPPENTGLSSFANTSSLLGSPGSAQRSLNTLTITAILFYFIIAVISNIN
jgi:preprotein translocase subunit SecG